VLQMQDFATKKSDFFFTKTLAFHTRMIITQKLMPFISHFVFSECMSLE
jgi:hypothetical protein